MIELWILLSAALGIVIGVMVKFLIDVCRRYRGDACSGPGGSEPPPARPMFRGRPVMTSEEFQKSDFPDPPEPEWQKPPEAPHAMDS